MKYLIVLFFIPLVVHGQCQNRIPESEAIRAINLVPESGMGVTTCEAHKDEICYCADGVSDWRAAEMIPDKKLIIMNMNKLRSLIEMYDKKVQDREAARQKCMELSEIPGKGSTVTTLKEYVIKCFEANR